jgi:hypothetical protein
MRVRSLAVLACSTTALFALAADAHAQVPSLDLRGFRAPTDPASGLYLEPAASPQSYEWNLGLWLGYARRPVTLEDEAGETQFVVIGNQLSADLTAQIGFAERLALGFDMPFVLAQGGDDPNAASRVAIGETALPLNALGDIGLVAKATLIKPTGGSFGGFALALHDRFTLPSGDEASFVGEGHVTNELRVLAEYNLVALAAHAALGVKLRGEREGFACGDVPVDACETRFGHEVPFGLGVAFRPQAFGLDDAGRWTWFLETHGHLPLAPEAPFTSSALSAVELGAGARVKAGDFSFLAGVELPLISGIGSPAFRGLLSVSWAPRMHDADKDGVADEADQCPELAEDRDLFEDDDGCPDGDNDDDGVPDGDDRCPTEKEDEDGVQDDDGCADPDNDGDKVLDVDDACPDEAGPSSPNPKNSGCPMRDRDADGIEGDKDACPEAAEDKDGFQDEDGCPDPDNDGDGVLDGEDACPTLKGADSANPRDKGCPDPDRDRDTYNDAEDKCPDAPEVFDGIEDTDGCPEGEGAKGKPLAVIRETKDGPVVEMAAAVKFAADHQIDPVTMPLVRALAVELRKHPEWTVAVGVRPPAKAGAEDGGSTSLLRAFSVVDSLRRFTRRDTIAETVAWVAVRNQPRAEAHGIGFLVLAPAPEAKPDSTPAKPADKGAEKAPSDKPADKKPGDKPPADKKPGDKPPADKKPGDKPPAEKPPEKKPGDKPAEPTPPPKSSAKPPPFELPPAKP